MRKVILVCGLCAFTAVGAIAADAPKTKSAQSIEKPRIAYTAIRVTDADRSLKFYVGQLGMKERQRIPLDGGVQEILIGFGDPNKDAGLLLLFNPNHKEPYTHGDAYHRLILSVDDLSGLLGKLKSGGVKIIREPTRVENLKLTYAFVADPDGYLLELVQND